MFSQQVEKFRKICGQSLDRVAWLEFFSPSVGRGAQVRFPAASKETVQGVENREIFFLLRITNGKRKSRAVIPAHLVEAGRKLAV
jgi:hypothetical protein